MVLDEVWRGLDGVEALSGAPGGPLRRTVKLILDPLVIRPVRHPLCAPAVLDDDGVALLTALVHAQSDTLRACAAWFVLLKQVRRSLRITEGNAQDLYFQRCFELATLHGTPAGERARTLAVATLREVHESTGGRTTAALKAHVTEPHRAAELTELLVLAWSRRPVADYGTRDRAAELTELLDACTLARAGDPADAGPLFDDLVEDRVGTRRGIALWHVHAAHGADALGLTCHPSPHRPQLGASASTANLALPFDRTVYERVFTVLQGSTDRTDLPEIPELVLREISRSCAPWGLLDESLRVAAAAGTELALGLSPITADQAGPRGGSRAHEVINARWRREAYVLQARRLAVHVVAHGTVVAASGAETLGRVDGVSGAAGDGGALGIVAAELRVPWRPYLRRLWVRLHGRDVREAGVWGPDELWDLLDGVARSVMLDHRDRVKQVLSAGVATGVEARAS
ncbi:hypothetical protein [Nocardia sp. AG03]|uniref:hypothetical protein n=1 Tax=Nocardia sp. AG03 TaxID=3025312 RepID=UPI00241893A8|nr:hypothetical protein [Nocardia sp. AG03]